jgi:hypothetical protein
MPHKSKHMTILREVISMDAKETVKQVLDVLNNTDETDKKLLECMTVAYSNGLAAGYQMNNKKEG